MIKNELLQQAAAKVQEGVQNKEAFDKLVKAGGKVIYDQKTFAQLSQGLAESQTPVEDIAKGMVAVLNMMAHRARGTIPHDALLQAGMALLIDALDFAEQAGLVKVGKEELATATTEFIEALLPSVGMTPGKLSDMLGQLEQTMADPQKVQAFKGAKQ